MSTGDKSSILKQKSEVLIGKNTVTLHGSCVLQNGILQLSEDQKNLLELRFEAWRGSVSFFIPASGSGSRMFSGVMDFINSGEETSEIKQFFDNLPQMALFQELPMVIKEKYNSLQSIYVAQYLISNDGMNLPSQPKGLIPFHIHNGQCLNPFQEQLLQARTLLGKNGKVHFTVQSDFEDAVIESLKKLRISGIDESVSFSFQDDKTDAYCFDEDGALVMEEDKPLRRPAGHGALLKNLNAIDADLVFIKNIDNVQHSNKSGLNRKVWKYCAGLLIEFKDEMLELDKNFSKSGLEELNNKYQFLSEQEEKCCDHAAFKQYLSRPSRVCGMVLNEGAPGGGPFWVDDNGAVSKQIVEKVQIAPDDNEIMEQSSHFNPVFIALSKTDVHGDRLDLEKYVDSSKYLLVEKPHNGKLIRYRELPGLWNGGMHNWNSIFAEIPKEVFSPVKSVFDLMKDAHRP